MTLANICEIYSGQRLRTFEAHLQGQLVSDLEGQTTLQRQMHPTVFRAVAIGFLVPKTQLEVVGCEQGFP